jgi:hypothetical protein
MNKYSGNAFWSWNAIGLACVLGLIVFSFFLEFTYAIVIVLLGMVLLAAVGWQMHYFIITEEAPIVRNQLLPWMHRTYNFRSISELYFEDAIERSRSMIIRGNNGRKKVYPAGSLRDETWSALRKALGDKGLFINDWR